MEQLLTVGRVDLSSVVTAYDCDAEKDDRSLPHFFAESHAG